MVRAIHGQSSDLDGWANLLRRFSVKKSTPNPNPNQKTAAIYRRVSDEKQRDNNSLKAQLDRCRAYAKQNGYFVAPEHEFKDVFSGSTLHRPAFNEVRALM